MTSNLMSGLPRWLSGKRICLPMQESRVQSLGWEDPLQEEMATHSNFLALEILWTEEPDGLQSMGWQRIRHDWATEHAHTHACILMSRIRFDLAMNPSLHLIQWFSKCNLWTTGDLQDPCRISTIQTLFIMLLSQKLLFVMMVLQLILMLQK